MRNRAHRRSHTDATELNITPFMNLMVVLIPFLLTGVVFSRLAILEMKLPAAQEKSAVSETVKDPFRLVVTLRETGLTVLGTGIDRVEFPVQGAVYDLSGLATLLTEMKALHPGEKGLILLSEPDISYDSLIAVMDVCREKDEAALFPEISIGEVQAL